MKNYKYIFLSFLFILLVGCSNKKDTLFSKINSNESGITFRNDLPYTEEFNTYTYRNFYNGGGVALGDINNDGLLDIYLSGNINDSKLYLNKGDWNFEDITESAGVACTNVWSTGITFVDINADGLLDLYVCKAGKPEGQNRHNELFINNGDLTFSEQAKSYGLDITGLSIHAAFFDYDLDGDLDCYLLNNSIRSVGGFDLKEGLRDVPDPEGNKLLRNDNGKFSDVTSKAGLYSSSIGYGLGITLADFNLDGWPDIFISNDFFERDYFYSNNGDGTFSEIGTQTFQSMSMGSMGADACDIDNDLKPDLFVTEMLPQTLDRKKTKASYETWERYDASVKKGYHHQFTRNALQRNIGGNTFLEIGRFSGVAATEWSWASLIQDFDNDGLKDLFVSNGIYKDLLDKDYLNFFANDILAKITSNEEEGVIQELIDKMPSHPIKNQMFKNIGDFQFTLVSDEWGLDEYTFSNGSAYGDLDNDGDLDLVINNANMDVSVYRNNLKGPDHSYLQINLIGSGKNTKAIGSKIVAFCGKNKYLVENYTSKGFQSSIDNKIHFGLGKTQVIDTLIITWPDKTQTKLFNIAANQLIEVDQSKAERSETEFPLAPVFKKVESNINFKHKEHDINVFSRERLLIEMCGFTGPKIAIGKINNDDNPDVFFGGGKLQSSLFYVSDNDEFTKSNFNTDEKKEVTEAIFFDADNDGDDDLYIGYGGKSFSIYSSEMNDLFLENTGNGQLQIKTDGIDFPNPMNTGAVVIGDLDNDGLLDIVVGEAMKNDLFGLDGDIIILMNMGNLKFETRIFKSLSNVGMISDITLSDIDKDGWLDIVACGQWMPVKIFYNQHGIFSAPHNLPESSGLWNTMEKFDIDQDGDDDFLLGNAGINNFYSTNLSMFINDFDNNGAAEQIICEESDGKYYPIQDLGEMYTQIPGLKKKYLYYHDCAQASMQDLFGDEKILQAKLLQLDELRSLALINNNGKLEKKVFPSEIQYSTVNAIFAENNSTQSGIIYLGGNNYRIKPQFGRQDASFGWKFNVSLDKGELEFDIPHHLGIKGQIRDIKKLGDQLIFGLNNEEIKILDISHE